MRWETTTTGSTPADEGAAEVSVWYELRCPECGELHYKDDYQFRCPE